MRILWRILAVITLFLMVYGCAGPPAVREKLVGPEVQYENIRVAILQYQEPLKISAQDGVIENERGSFPLPSIFKVTIDEKYLHVNGKSFSLPATLRSSQPIEIDGKLYFGWLLIQDYLFINIVPIEEYVIGVLNAEIPASWPIEALRAQAIVSRTYAYRKIIDNNEKLFDVGSTEMYQKYDFVGSDSRITQAVKSTVDKVVLYDNEPIEVFFHSCSGGRTENSSDVFQRDLAYLRSIPDPYCTRDERFNWTFAADTQQVVHALKKLDTPIPETEKIKSIRMHRKTRSGRTKEFVIYFEDGSELIVDGNRFRIAMDPKGLKSLLISRIVTQKGEGELIFIFQGRGYGHGVGMSQWGAKGMADQGFGYQRILEHYYRGTRVGIIWDIL
jgi:stage II sporulation protein D